MDKNLIKEVIANINWSNAPQMPIATSDATTADAMFAGLTKYAVADNLAAMAYKDNNGDERQIIIIYTDHSVEVFYVDKSGRVFNRPIRKTEMVKQNRHKINTQGGGSVHVNELIVRINNISKGIIDKYKQQYNHHTMVKYAAETFGPDAGSMCSKDQNIIHKTLCERIHSELGIVANVKSYYSSATNVYGLLGLKQITLNHVAALNPRVVDGIYYFD